MSVRCHGQHCHANLAVYKDAQHSSKGQQEAIVPYCISLGNSDCGPSGHTALKIRQMLGEHATKSRELLMHAGLFAVLQQAS